MEPNITVRPSPLEVLKAAITLFVLLPCTAIYKTTKWLLSPKNDRGSLKEVFGRALIIGLAPSIPIPILQYIGSFAGRGSDVFKSTRYNRQKSQILTRVQQPEFAGYWVCRGLGAEPIALQAADVVLFYIHGGAYILGWPAMDAPQILMMAEMAAKQGLSMACFALEYSHTPEACLPVQVIQARAAYEWLVVDQGVSPSKISIMSESAGGHLALAVLMDLHLRPSVSKSATASARETQKLSKPASAFLLSPWVDLFNFNPKINQLDDFQRAFRTFLQKCAGMVLRTTPDQYRALVENFAVPAKERGSWKHILPDITWVSGGSEEHIFIEHIQDFVVQARKDGANVVLEVREGGEHAWQNAEARPMRKTFLASEPSGDDETLMSGYRAVARELVSIHKER